MILLSKVIKSSYTKQDGNEKRIIKLKPLAKEANRKKENKKQKEIENENHSLKKAEEHAQKLIQEAKRKAELMVEQAERNFQAIMDQIEAEKQNWVNEKQQWIDEARQQGHAAGFEIGKKEGLKQYKDLIQLAQQTIDQSKKDYFKNVEQAETTILQLGIKAAEKVLGYTLEMNSEAFINIVKNVMQEAKDYQNIQIRIHPMYYDLLLSHKEEMKALLNDPTTELYIYPDDELEQKACIIESSFGKIDASIDSQLHELKTKLLQYLEGDSDDEGD